MKILEIFRVRPDAEPARSGGRHRRLLRHDRRGSVLIVVAIAGMTLVCMVSLVVDVGMLLLAHREAQRAADSGALAGASAYLQFDPMDSLTAGTAYDSAEVRAYAYAQRHTMLHDSIIHSEVTPEILLATQRVRVTVRRPAIPLIFARLFGINTAGVSATAVAEAVKAGTATKCVKPFMIPDMYDDADQDANHNHVWEFDTLDAKGNAVEDWRFDPSMGDAYRPDSAGVSDPTGYYTTHRGGTDPSTQVAGKYWDPTTSSYQSLKYDKDAGRRIPVKLQSPGSGSYPSFWFAWRMPGAAGKADLTDEIEGCMSDVVPVGGMVETETGMAGMPIYDAFRNLIDTGGTDPNWTPADKNAYWKEGVGPVDGSGNALDTEHSARVVTVAIFNPTDMRSGNQEYHFVNFAKVFIEDPDVVYPNIKQKQQRPITVRLMKFAVGGGGPTTGTLVKRIRLVQ